MIKVAAVQMLSSHIVEENLALAEQLILKAVEEGVKFVVLPENFAFMGLHEKDKINIQEQLGEGPVQNFLKTLAKRHNIFLLGGTIPIATNIPDKVFATSLLFNDQGECLADYNKIHLFDVTINDTETHEESNVVIPGESIITAKTSIGTIGLSVCYDIRFPEMFRKMFLDNVEIICIPAAFTEVTGRAHWKVLCRARAIENLSYVIAPNQAGVHTNARESYGHSMVINHWGEVLAECDKGSGLAIAEIDLDKLHQKRKTFPVGEHRRFF